MNSASFLAALILTGFTLDFVPGLALGAGEPGDRPVVAELEAIRAAALSDAYALDQVRALSDCIGPRLSGSREAQAAVDHVAAQMRGLGLVVHLEEVKVPHWIRGREEGTLVSLPRTGTGTTVPLALTALGGSIPTPVGGLVAPVLVVDGLDSLAKLPRSQIAGKIVLFDKTFDAQRPEERIANGGWARWGTYRTNGVRAAAASGAVAALIRSSGPQHSNVPHAALVRYDTKERSIPAASISGADADRISTLARSGVVHMRLNLQCQRMEDVISANVIADLPGEKVDDVVIVSGHLDSWDQGTGALDDATGVAMAMETVEIFHRLHLKPRRTIRMVAWMGEEWGSLGAQSYLKLHRLELKGHVAAIESDRGADEPLGVAASAESSLLDQLGSALANIPGAEFPTLRRAQPLPVTDVRLLAQAGVPTFCLLQDLTRYREIHHTRLDTFDKVTPSLLAENCATMAVLADALAQWGRPDFTAAKSKPKIRFN